MSTAIQHTANSSIDATVSIGPVPPLVRLSLEGLFLSTGLYQNYNFCNAVYSNTCNLSFLIRLHVSLEFPPLSKCVNKSFVGQCNTRLDSISALAEGFIPVTWASIENNAK